MSDEETQNPVEEPRHPIDIKRIIDGGDFIKEIQAEDAPALVPFVVNGREFSIRILSGGQEGSVLIGQFRDGDAGKEFDALATADRLFCMTIQQCVVKEVEVKGKKEIEPLWSMPNVIHMYNGSPKAALFSPILKALYDKCIEVNPGVHPAGNPTAHQRLFRWF